MGNDNLKNEADITSNGVLPEVNFADFYYRSFEGIQISHSIPMIKYVCGFDKKLTWAEKRKDELVWKLKSKKANLNKFIVTILMIGSVVVTLGICFGLAFLVRSDIMGLALGYCGAQLILLAYYFWTDKFECSPSMIRVKHKGKIYCC